MNALLRLARVLSFALVWPAFAATTPPTIEQFFGLPNVRQPRLSPDGKKIAFLFPHEKRMALGVFDRSTNESRLVIRGEDESIFSFFWKGNDRIVFEGDVSGNESFFVGSTDLTGRKVLRLAESQRVENGITGTIANMVDPFQADPSRIVVAAFFADNADTTVFVGRTAVVAKLNVLTRTRSPVLELSAKSSSGCASA